MGIDKVKVPGIRRSEASGHRVYDGPMAHDLLLHGQKREVS